MTIGGKDVIMRETLIVILNEGEGSAAVVGEMEAGRLLWTEKIEADD